MTPNRRASPGPSETLTASVSAWTSIATNLISFFIDRLLSHVALRYVGLPTRSVTYALRIGAGRSILTRRRRSVTRTGHPAKRVPEGPSPAPDERVSWPAMERRHLRLGFAGFGNVGRALARLLIARRDELSRRLGLSFDVTLLASARRGARVEPGGIDLERALHDGWSSGSRLQEVLAGAPID